MVNIIVQKLINKQNGRSCWCFLCKLRTMILHQQTYILGLSSINSLYLGKLYKSSVLQGENKQENAVRNTCLRSCYSRCSSLINMSAVKKKDLKVIEDGFDPATLKFVQALQVAYRTGNKTIEEKDNNAYK